jgi:hypothetical protein
VLARGVRAATATPPLRWSPAWSSAGRLIVRATCRAADGRCRGRATVSLRLRAAGPARWVTRRLATRVYRTTSARRTVALTLRVPGRTRRLARTATRRRVVIAVRPAVPVGSRGTVTLTIAGPR